MIKKRTAFWRTTVALIGTTIIYLGILILNRQYGFYGNTPEQQFLPWLGLHMGNAVVQMMVPVLFLLTGFWWGQERLSLAHPIQYWLVTVSALIIGTAAIFAGFKQLTLPAMVASVLPLTQNVSAIFTSFIAALIIQPLFVWLLDRWGQWPGWGLAGITVIAGLLLTPAQQSITSLAAFPLMLGMMLLGMVLRRSRWAVLGTGRTVILTFVMLLLTWGSQVVLGMVSMYYEGDYRFIDRLAGPFSLPVILTAAGLVLLIARGVPQRESTAVLGPFLIAFTLSQSPYFGQILFNIVLQDAGSSVLRFGVLSVILAAGLGLLTLLWTILMAAFFRRPFAWLTQNLAFTAQGPVKSGLRQLGRALRTFWRREWPPLMLLIVFYLTVFGSFLAMSPTGTIEIGLKGDTQSIWDYLLGAGGQTMILYTGCFLIAAFFILYVLTTRFWTSFVLTEAVYVVWTAANAIKMVYRSAPITPADLHELASLPELMAMLGKYTIWWVLLGLLVLAGIIVLLEKRLPRKISVNWGIRLGGVLLGFLLLLSPATANNPGSYARIFNAALGNGQNTITPLKGVQMNGPLLQFVNAVDIDIMDKPAGYSQARIQAIMTKYQKRAAAINRTRSTNIGDENVIFNLSESFADPKQFPDVKVGGTDPMAYIRQLVTETTGGHMLSAGYGGGTANMEYESLTGLVMGNFAANVVPFSQVVPQQSKVAAFNQNFDYSTAIHPYNGTFYNRPAVYRKMGIDKYAYLGSQYPITDQSKIQKNPYLSDKTAYANALKQLQRRSGSQFIELVTMQNHMPYEAGYYPNNPYAGKVTGAALKDKNIAAAFATYTYGVSQSDKAVAQFIKDLDQIKKPVTVVFYGDHFPGIVDNKYLVLRPVRMHATMFFIYSNKASAAHNNKLKDTNYVGTNDFIPLVLEHLDAKVSPYEALLTDVDHDLPIMSMPPNTKKNKQGKVKTSPAWVGDDGDWYDAKKMSKKQKRLYAEYRLIQYDLTAGNQYALQKKAFMHNPGKN